MDIAAAIADFLARRFGDDTVDLLQISPAYDVPLVFIGLLLAAVAGTLVSPVLEAIGRARNPAYKRGLLALGATGLGVGIWSMHFTTMVATSLPVIVNYSALGTLISIVPAIVGAAFAIRVLGSESSRPNRVFRAGLYFALGVAGMHYGGMEAMSGLGGMRYRPVDTLLVILCAPLISTAAFYCADVTHKASQLPTILRASGGLVIGLAVTAIHFQAMYATEYYLSAANMTDVTAASTVIAHGVLSAVTILLVITMLTALSYRKFVGLKNALLDEQDLTMQILEQADDFHLLIDERGRVLSANLAADLLFNSPMNDLVGSDITDVLPAAVSDESNTSNKLEEWCGQRLQILLTNSANLYATGTRLTGLREISRTLEISTTKVMRGTGVVYSMMGHEITIRLEEEKRSQFLAKAVESSNESIVILDNSRKINYMNPAARRRMRNKRDAYIGKRPEEVFYELVNSPQVTEMRAALASGLPWKGELIRCKDNGDLLREAVSISTITDKAGEVGQFVVMTRVVVKDKAKIDMDATVIQSKLIIDS